MDEEAVCYKCVGDEYLKAVIKKSKRSAECSICGGRRKSMNLDSLVQDIAVIFQDYFEMGGEIEIWDPEKDRISYYEPVGDSLAFYIGEILQLDEDDDLVRAIQDKLVNASPEDAGFFDSETFVRKELAPEGAERDWADFLDGVTHRNRFFNRKAEEYLRSLFTGISDLRVAGRHSTSVLRLLGPDDKTKIFRARKPTSPREGQAIIDDPYNQLAAPPRELTKDWRMSPKGIPAFYGALETPKTCIYELRPAVGGIVISGEFKLTREISVFDFTALEVAYESHSLSYFDPDYRSKSERRKFLRTFHNLISQPVLPGGELDYLKTQVIAGFLATECEPRVDGVIYASSQHKGGKNIVLFSHAITGDGERASKGRRRSERKPALEFVPNSVTQHAVSEVKFTVEDERVIDGQLESVIDAYYERR